MIKDYIHIAPEDGKWQSRVKNLHWATSKPSGAAVKLCCDLFGDGYDIKRSTSVDHLKHQYLLWIPRHVPQLLLSADTSTEY